MAEEEVQEEETLLRYLLVLLVVVAEDIQMVLKLNQVDQVVELFGHLIQVPLQQDLVMQVDIHLLKETQVEMVREEEFLELLEPEEELEDLVLLEEVIHLQVE